MCIKQNYCETRRGHVRQAGISMIELMVGVVIGMLTVLVVANSIIVSEGQRRGTSSGNDALNNATISAYLLERDLRMAGFGLFTNEVDGLARVCLVGKVLTYNKDRTPSNVTYDATNVTPTTFLPFAPVFINPGALPPGDSNSDVVLVNYSGGTLAVVSTGIKLGGAAATAATTFKINASEDSLGGFRTGDLMLAVESGRDCSLYEVTGPRPVAGDTVERASSGSYVNDQKGSVSVTPTWNKIGGLGVDYTQFGLLYNLGAADQLTSVAYAVRNGNLTRCNLMTSDCLSSDTSKTGDPTIWVPVATNIVALKAELGVDTTMPQDFSLDAWRKRPCSGANCTPTYDEWARLKAMRIGLIARSSQYNKEEVTSSVPVWQGTESFDLSTGTDWKHYRYGIVEFVVPIRNIAFWSPL